MQSSAASSVNSEQPLPEGFVKVEGGATEQVSETTSLLVAYTSIWLILMVFTLATWRSLRSLRVHAARIEKTVGPLPLPPQ
jgi:hypothetical protein